MLPARRVKPGRMAYQQIINSPYREEIDTMISENEPVRRIHQWLVEQGVDDISYSTINRYRRDMQERSRPTVVIETSKDDVRRNYNGLNRIVEKGLTAIDQGMLPRPQDVLAAIKLQSEMLSKLGIGVNVEVMETAQQNLRTLVYDIVLPVLNDDQKRTVLEKILENDDLASWVIDDPD